MSSFNTKWILELVDNITSPLKNIDGNIKSISGKTGVLNKHLKDTSAINISAIAEGFRSLKNRLDEAVAPGIKFQSGLADVEAITGVTGKALDSLGLKARQSAKNFGGDASDSLENYKIILSKLGPDIAKSEPALDSMNNNVLTLSKTMKGDTKGAVDALTTSMLQFRIDLADPIKAAAEMSNQMNVMAAGAKFGSAEVPEVTQAIKVSGVAASQANVSFAETNAAIQELSRGGKDGAEGGMALRNVLNKIAGEDVIPAEALQKLKHYGVNMKIVSDTSLPFTTRLRELGKAQNDATAFAQIFGVENAAGATILTRSVDAQDDLLSKITNTNVATEQATTIMATYSEKMSRYSAFFKNIGISIFNGSQSFLPFINGGFEAIDVLADLKRAHEGVALIMDTKLGKGLKMIGGGFKWAGTQAFLFGKSLVLTGWNALKSAGSFVFTALTGLGSYVVGLVSATAAQMGLNIAMNANPIGAIVIGIGLAIGAIVLLVKYWDNIKNAIISFTTWVWNHSPFKFIIDLVDIIFPDFKAKVSEVFEYVKGLVLGFWNKIKEVWGNIKKFFGFGNDLKAEIKVKYDKDRNIIPPTNEPNPFGGLKVEPTRSLPKSSDMGVTGTGGSGSGKSITMNLDIKNYFNITGGHLKGNIDEFADKIVGKINDKLRDAAISLG